jgi:cytochrome b
MNPPLMRYRIWDRTTRLFHWINAICVIMLMLLGTLILNHEWMGIVSEVNLKRVHSWFGYVLVVNLAWRMIWGFIGGHYARWRQLLPLGPRQTLAYVSSLSSGKPQQYLGHNPLGRLIITAFFLLLSVQAVTGLMIAGMDLYQPPFGSYFANWVTDGDPERLAALKPGDRSATVESSYNEMRAFRGPIVRTHEYNFYLLALLVLVHTGGVIYGELREKNGLISAMITGDKVLDEAPADGVPKP